MKTTAQIVFFILLSFTMHLMLLPLDFMSSAVPYDSGQIEVSYLSKPLDSFYPGPVPQKKINQVVKTSVQKSLVVEKKVPRQPEPDATPAVEAVRPDNSRSVTKPDLEMQEPAVTRVVDPLPAKVVEKLVPVESDPVDIVDIKDSLPVKENLEKITLDPQQELISQPLSDASVAIGSQVGEDFSSPEELTAPDELATNNQTSDYSVSDQANISGQGFKDALPRYDINPPPQYPQVAKLRGWEGKVVFEASILKNGRVGRLKIMASSGYRSLDSAARKAISRWKFSPATSFGLPIDSEVEIPVNFSLKDL